MPDTALHTISIPLSAQTHEVAALVGRFMQTRNEAEGSGQPEPVPVAESLRIAKEFRAWIGDAPDRFDDVQNALPLEEDPMDWLLDDLPWRLAKAGMIDELADFSRSFAEVTSPDSFLGDLALRLGEAGRHDEALAQAQSILERFPDDPWTVIRAGEVHQLREELDQAEAAYRKALSMAGDDGFTRAGVLERLAPMLEQCGRAEEAGALIAEEQRRQEERRKGVKTERKKERKKERASSAVAAAGASESNESLPEPFLEPARRESPKVGRNAPCPCGSGKKHKRCCGA